LRNISKQSYSKEFSSLNQRFQVVRLAGRAGRATSRLIMIRTTTRTINRVLFYHTTLKKAISFLGKRYFVLKYKYFVCCFTRQPWVILVSIQLFCAYPSVILVSTLLFWSQLRYFIFRWSILFCRPEYTCTLFWSQHYQHADDPHPCLHRATYHAIDQVIKLKKRGNQETTIRQWGTPGQLGHLIGLPVTISTTGPIWMTNRD
jgi:hypothetical protein